MKLADISGTKKKEYLKAKIEELEIVRKKILGTCTGASMTLRRVTSLRSNRVKDEKGDLVADSHSILVRWRNHFSQLLNIHGVNDVRQTELHTAEPQVPEPSTSEAELAIEKLKRHNHQVLTKSQQN